MGLLQRLQVRAQIEFRHRFGLAHGPELTTVLEGPLFGPQAQHDLQRFTGHLAVDAGLSIDIEHREIGRDRRGRSEEHTSELQSLMRLSYAVFCLKIKNYIHKQI